MGLNFSRMILDVFAGRDPGCVVWQPRLDFWYEVNKKRGTLPGNLKDASLLEVYDYCHASIRYFTNPLRHDWLGVQTRQIWEDTKTLRWIYETPVGVLTEAFHYDDYGLSSYNSEYKLKTPEDFAIYEWMLQHERWWWDPAVYAQDLQQVGQRGAPAFYFRRSPVQGLFIENMGFETTIFLLADHPEVVEAYVEVAAAADDAMYQVLGSMPVPILNFGENIDAHMDPPTIWLNHLLPYYQKRVAQLNASGKSTCIHIDGAMKPLIRLIGESPFQAIEACTPLPQGDVTLEEIRTALGERILVDGIPAVYFLPYFPLEELKACTQRVVELFHPRLILGASDEVPPDSDIERVRLVGEWIQEML